MVTPSLPVVVGLPLLAPPDANLWMHLGLAVLGLFVGTVGAHAAAALLVYSPTKLSRLRRRSSRIVSKKAAAKKARGNDKARPDAAMQPSVHARHVAELQEHEREFELVAWLLAMAGLATSISLTAQASRVVLGWPLLLILGVCVAFLFAALPLTLARTRPEAVVVRTLPALRVARWLLRYPLIAPVAAVTRALLRIVRISDAVETDPEQIAEDIVAAVSDSAQENALAEEERHWIENIVELKELTVSEAMTPRTDVIAFEAEMDLRDAVQRAIDTGFSRYPVYEDKVDTVVGVFYAKDALARLSNGASKQVPVRDVMRKPLFVPESMGVIELLGQFKATKRQLAIVLDEYGGTAGLISIEDILEEIVGDMTDEFDTDEEAAIRVITEARVVEISGRARVDEVNEVFGGNIPENGEYDTVAGYVFTNLGRIPKVGDTLQMDGVEFEILRADDRRIDRMRLTLLEPTPSEPE